MVAGGHVEEEEEEELTLLKMKRKKLSTLRLWMLTICFSGVQFGWALQIALLTPFMLELGLPKSMVTIVWLCGPIAGLIMQPLIGVLSDRCQSKFGKRRPYIVGGAVLIAISLLLIPNSLDIGRLFGDTAKDHTAAMILAVIGFWILDFSNNMLQGPCRALIPDLAHPEQQELGFSASSVWLGVGSVTGYVAGFIDWSAYFSFSLTDACLQGCANLRIAFSISCFFLIVTVITTCIFSQEPQLVPVDNGGIREKQDNVFVKIVKQIYRMSGPMRRVCIVQFFSWFAWFAFLMYITDWVGENVYQGTPEPFSYAYKAYQAGVRTGCIGMAVFAAVSMIASPLVVFFVKLVGFKPVWFFGCISLAVPLASTFLIREPIGAVIVIGFFGFPWAVAMTVPFALTGILAPKGDKGLYIGVLNIFVVVPQLMMAAVAPLLTLLFHGNVEAMLILGSVSAFVGAVTVFFVQVKPDASQEEVIIVDASATVLRSSTTTTTTTTTATTADSLNSNSSTSNGYVIEVDQ